MVETIIRCDRCKNICEEDNNAKAMYVVERYGETLDLCETCNKLLNDFINMEGDYE